jgi:hypothetical protein
LDQRTQEDGAMTLLFRVKINDEVHEVRVDLPAGSDTSRPGLEEFVLTTAWLEHLGRLPRGVTNALD